MILTKCICMQNDLSKPKYEFLIKNCDDAGTKHFNDPNAFIEYSNTMDGIYGNIDDYNPSRNRKILIAFDDMIADIMTNKKFQAIIKELFIRCRKLNISLDFITQSFFCSIQHIWLWKIQKKIYREIQNIAMNHSPDIDYKDFVKIYRECTKKTFFFDNWYYVTSKWSSKI